VSIEGAGSTVTSDSGEFSFPLSGNLKVGYPVIFHVTSWVIVKPCELKNGRTYLRDPGAEPIELLVFAPHDPRLIASATGGSIIDCIIEEEATQFAPRSGGSVEHRSSLPTERRLPFAPQTDSQGRVGVEARFLHSHLIEAAYRLPSSPDPLPSTRAGTRDVNDPAKEEFLTEKARELGFSVAELKSAVEKWTLSAKEVYAKGLAAYYDGRYAEASRYIAESLSSPGSRCAEICPASECRV